MTIKSKDYLATPGKKVDLAKIPTNVKPLYKSKEECKKILEENVEKLSDLQKLLYASNKYALLLIFQGMDGSGKDSAIAHTMSGVNPQGFEAFSFKQPSSEELQHDFLWRTTCRLPERGRIGIFNRSYYEEVLVVKVHPEILQKQRLPEEVINDKEIWGKRYRSIVNLEEHLAGNGTKIIKFFFHLSQGEQQNRFRARMEDPTKNWKISLTDAKESTFWPKYMEAYAECLQETSKENAPWYIVPADDQRNSRLIVSQIILDAMSELKMEYPKSTVK